jgi:hypothetical protein
MFRRSVLPQSLGLNYRVLKTGQCVCPKLSVYFYYTTWHHIPEVNNLHYNSREVLISYTKNRLKIQGKAEHLGKLHLGARVVLK